jgi:hypothetical protein
MNTDIHVDQDGEYTLPCVEALLAGTLALMTGHAQSDDAVHRGLMAKKIASNLFFLHQHPGLTEAFRTVLARLQKNWQQFDIEGSAMASATPQRLWHEAHRSVQ